MFGKLFSGMYDGTLATVGPWEALVTFQQFIVLSDPHGIVDMTAEAIARRTTIPLEIIRVGIRALEKPDPQSRTPDEEGKRIVRLSDDRPWGWQIVNYAHYRALRTTEDRREYMKNYQREYRKQSKSRKHSVNTCKQNTPRNSASTSSLNSLKENFKEFWDRYPFRKGRKVGKGNTRKLFECLSNDDQLLAIEAACNYSASEGAKNGFAKDPERFLKGERGEEFWRDWLEPVLPTSNHSSRTCARRIEVNKRFKTCGKPGTKTIGKNSLCDDCHAAHLKEQQSIKGKDRSDAK